MLRRNFLIGCGALIAAPAIVRIQNIMPVRKYDPLVWGVRWQSWPICMGRPFTDYASSTITNEQGRKHLSHFIKSLDRHKDMWPMLEWKELTSNVF